MKKKTVKNEKKSGVSMKLLEKIAEVKEKIFDKRVSIGECVICQKQVYDGDDWKLDYVNFNNSVQPRFFHNDCYKKIKKGD